MSRIETPEFDAATKARLRPLVSAELKLKNPLDESASCNRRAWKCQKFCVWDFCEG